MDSLHVFPATVTSNRVQYGGKNAKRREMQSHNLFLDHSELSGTFFTNVVSKPAIWEDGVIWSQNRVT
jgi:hypothetical protein